MKKITLLIITIFIYVSTIAQCNEPSNIHIENNFTYESVKIVWDANTENLWDIEYGENGFTPTEIPTIENVSFNQLGLDQIPHSIYYDLYIRTDCGADTSDWIGPFTFYNYCDISVSDIIVNETFNTGNFPPDCWTVANQGNPNIGISGFNNSNWTNHEFANDSNDLSAMINITENNVNDWLVLPEMQGLPGVKSNNFDLILNFSIALTEHNTTNSISLGSDDQVKLVISPDQGETWFTIRTWDANTPISNTGETIAINYEDYTDQFSLFDTHFLIAFWASSGSIDDSVNADFFLTNIYAEPPSTGSINDLKSKGFSYYPNPIKNTLHLNANENIDTVSIYNYLGQEVKTILINSIQKEINLNNLEKGVYFMNVKIGNTTGFISLIKE